MSMPPALSFAHWKGWSNERAMYNNDAVPTKAGLLHFPCKRRWTQLHRDIARQAGVPNNPGASRNRRPSRRLIHRAAAYSYGRKPMTDAPPMLTVDERARSMVIQAMNAAHPNMMPLARARMEQAFLSGANDENLAVVVAATAINQLDEARSQALEEAARVAEYRGPFGDAAYQTPKEIAAAIRALNIKPAAPSGFGILSDFPDELPGDVCDAPTPPTVDGQPRRAAPTIDEPSG